MDPECCGPRSANRGAVAFVIPIPISVWSSNPAEREQQKLQLAEEMIQRADKYLPGLAASIDRSTLFTVSPYEAQEWM